jgi:predicted phage tail protein
MSINIRQLSDEEVQAMIKPQIDLAPYEQVLKEAKPNQWYMVEIEGEESTALVKRRLNRVASMLHIHLVYKRSGAENRVIFQVVEVPQQLVG